ncbi:MAG: hypothetical protein AAGA87_00345 [Pseudomonadota bacterium]
MFVFLNNMEGAPRERAVELLEQESDPSLDWVRRQVYLDEWRNKPDAEQELIRIQRENLGGRLSLKEHLRTIETITQRYDRPFYGADAKAETLAHFYERHLLHPQDYWLADELLKQLGENSRAVGDSYSAQDIARSWHEMHDLSQYSGFFWRFSAYLVQAVSNPYALDAQSDFYANAIYYGNHQSTHLGEAMGHYHWLYRSALTAHERYSDLDGDPEELRDELLCKLVRASRLFEASCPADVSGICKVGGYFDAERNEIRRLWPKAKNCRYAPPAAVSTLRYSPRDIPADIFEELIDD